jgi:hypothetical protein
MIFFKITVLLGVYKDRAKVFVSKEISFFVRILLV